LPLRHRLPVGTGDDALAALGQRTIVGLLVSVPSALVTKAYLPIVGLGLVGGAICGLISGKWGAI
jgi:hypothetical protein